MIQFVLFVLHQLKHHSQNLQCEHGLNFADGTSCSALYKDIVTFSFSVVLYLFYNPMYC